MPFQSTWPLFFLSFLLLTAGALCHAQSIYAVVLGNQNHVVGSSTLESGLFVSQDRGETWRQLGPRNLKAYSVEAVRSQMGRVLYIAAGNGIHRSTDSGVSWKIITGWEMTEVLDVAVDQSDPDFIYAATAFGLWWSEDGGESWQQTRGPHSTEYIYRVAHSTYADRSTLTLYTDMRQRPSYEIVSDSGPVRPHTIRETDRIHWKDSCIWQNAYDVIGVNPGTRNLQAKTVYTDSSRVIEQLGSSHGYQLTCDSVRFFPVGKPLPSPVHALAALSDPWPYRLIAGTFGDGVFAYDDGEWRQIGLPGAQVWSIEIFDF